MRILHAIFCFKTGGSETMLADIVNEQCKTEEVWLLVVNDEVDPNLFASVDKRVKFLFLKRTPKKKINLFFHGVRLQSLLAKIKPDVIHCHDNNLFPFFIRWKKKTCLTVHSVIRTVKYLHNFQKIFAISQTVYDDLKKRADIESTIVYNGILIDEHRQRTDYRLELSESFRIIQIGRLHPLKGQDTTVKAIARLARQYPDLSIELTFAGDGPTMEYLQQLTKQFELENRIHFLGQIDRNRIKENLCNYHLLVNPSLTEGFGLTVVEGLAAGLPVIASDIEGPKEILSGLHTGILIQPQDEAELADKIFRVWEAYKNGTVLEKGYTIKDRRLLSKFDLKETARNYVKYYKEYFISQKSSI